jgi:hypothetical protein
MTAAGGEFGSTAGLFGFAAAGSERRQSGADEELPARPCAPGYRAVLRTWVLLRSVFDFKSTHVLVTARFEVGRREVRHSDPAMRD